MKGRRGLVDEICVLAGFSSLQHAGSDCGGYCEHTAEGRALWDSRKHLEASVNSFKGFVLVSFWGSLLKV